MVEVWGSDSAEPKKIQEQFGILGSWIPQPEKWVCPKMGYTGIPGYTKVYPYIVNLIWTHCNKHTKIWVINPLSDKPKLQEMPILPKHADSLNMWHFSLNMDFSWRCGSFVVAPLTHRPGVPRTGSEGGDQPWWRMADGYHLGAHWGQGCCYLRPSSEPPKLNGESPFFHIEIWGKCTSFRQTQIPLNGSCS